MKILKSNPENFEIMNLIMSAWFFVSAYGDFRKSYDLNGWDFGAYPINGWVDLAFAIAFLALYRL